MKVYRLLSLSEAIPGCEMSKCISNLQQRQLSSTLESGDMLHVAFIAATPGY